MNPIAIELNEKLKNNNQSIFEVLSELGKKLFFPKGILSQSAEAKKLAKKYNATIGIAKEKGAAMYLPEIMNFFNNLNIDQIAPYAPSYGQPGLRKIWKEKIYQKNSALNKTEISLPIVTSGITHGLSIVSDLFIDENDTILLPDKIWGNYRLTFIVRKKANFESFKFFKGSSFNLSAFENKINELKTKLKKLTIILNFPNNPIGYSPTVEEAKKIAEILINAASDAFKIVTVTDDAYFGLFFEPEVYTESIFGLVAGKNKNLLAVKLDGATKEDYVWGFRTGFITYGAVGEDVKEIYDSLEKKTGGCIRGNISNCSNIAQSILTELYSSSDYDKQKKEKFEILKNRANKVKEVLSKNDKYNEVWDMYPFNSGYFMCLKLKNIDSEELRQLLLNEYGIGTISPNPTDLRIAFSSVELDNIEDMFEQIFDAAKKIN